MIWYQLTRAPNHSLQNSLSSMPLPPALRGLAYGDGFFTTIGVHKGQPLWHSYHQQRIRSHTQALHLHLSDEQHALWQAVHTHARDIEHGIIKIIITRKAQPLRGYMYSPTLADNACLVWVGVSQTEPLAVTTADTLFVKSFRPASPASLDIATPDTVSPDTASVILQQPPITAICLTSQLASLPKPLAGLKTLNRLDNVLAAGDLARLQLHYSDAAEGLVSDMAGHWVEGVMSNVFYRLNDDEGWYTPPIIASGVRGVMRQVVLDAFAKRATSDVQAHERTLDDADLPNLQAMFFCNAVRGIVPVHRLIVGEGQEIRLSVL